MQYQDPRAAEARRLRLEEGMTSKEIRERLGVEKNKLQYWLAGLPTSQGLRTNARDDLKAKARQLRRSGTTYPEIAEFLGVSRSSVSLWVRDIEVDVPNAARGWTEEARARRTERLAKKHARQRVDRINEQFERRLQFGPFNERDILLNGAIAYWCEGAKVKPWRPSGTQMVFANMDPDLHRLFLRYLDAVPVEHGGAGFRLSIHQSADEVRAKAFWCRELGIRQEDFTTTLWKRHQPRTVRKNTEGTYYGCLFTVVRKCSKLYWYTENLAKAAMIGMSMAPVSGEKVR